MSTEYEKQIAALEQEIKRLKEKQEDEEHLAEKAAFEAKPPEEKAEIKWREASEHAAEYEGIVFFDDRTELLKKMFRDAAREAVRYEQMAKKEE
jgi:hypothetical protein